MIRRTCNLNTTELLLFHMVSLGQAGAAPPPRLPPALSCQDVLFILVTQNDFSSASQQIPIPGRRRKKVCPFLLRTLSRSNSHHLCLHPTGQNFLSHVGITSGKEGWEMYFN